jgi:purine-nucleoside phosphorylase
MHMGVEVLPISCVTNMAAGTTAGIITAEEVLEVGARVMGKFLVLLRRVLPKIAAYLQRAKK